MPEEGVQRLPTFEMIEQGLHRYAGAYEDRRPTKDLGIAVDHLRFRRHASPLVRCFGSYPTTGRQVPNAFKVSCGSIQQLDAERATIRQRPFGRNTARLLHRLVMLISVARA